MKSKSAQKRDGNVVHVSFAPRGLSMVEAAAYVGVCVSEFDQMVKDGTMPASKRVGTRRIWDRLEVDAAFDNLPGDSDPNEWDVAA